MVWAKIQWGWREWKGFQNIKVKSSSWQPTYLAIGTQCVTALWRAHIMMGSLPRLAGRYGILAMPGSTTFSHMAGLWATGQQHWGQMGWPIVRMNKPISQSWDFPFSLEVELLSHHHHHECGGARAWCHCMVFWPYLSMQGDPGQQASSIFVGSSLQCLGLSSEGSLRNTLS